MYEFERIEEIDELVEKMLNYVKSNRGLME